MTMSTNSYCNQIYYVAEPVCLLDTHSADLQGIVRPEMGYISLSTNNKWEGMGHSSSVFLSTTLGEDDGTNYARAMAVKKAQDSV